MGRLDVATWVGVAGKVGEAGGTRVQIVVALGNGAAVALGAGGVFVGGTRLGVRVAGAATVGSGVPSPGRRIPWRAQARLTTAIAAAAMRQALRFIACAGKRDSHL